jgi:hypothetical protein
MVNQNSGGRCLNPGIRPGRLMPRSPLSRKKQQAAAVPKTAWFEYQNIYD